MSGRTLMIGLIGFAVIFGAVLYYMQIYAFYESTEAETLTIAGAPYPVTDWQGIDASSSPLKARACFRLPGTPAAEPAARPTPLVAPYWFDCFDAEAIGRALESGEATAYLAEAGIAQGIDRMVARFPDGRAYMWHQLNDRYAGR